MVEEQLEQRGINDPRVLEACRSVPRHQFVRAGECKFAYDDRPLPIGCGQTISQPYMVALMTQCLRIKGGEKVLEVGTGSGYQTAILAELCGHVYTMERVGELSRRAQASLGELGYVNIDYHVGDGTLGWPRPGDGPFDGILVAAAAPHVPASLAGQLAEGGRIVIPVGSVSSQVLQVVCKQEGKLNVVENCLCTFVKLIGEDGWHES